MRVFKRVAPLSLLIVLCACGQLVEFGGDAAAGAGGGGRGGTGGRGGASDDAGIDDSGIDSGGTDSGSMDSERPFVVSTTPESDASNVNVTESVNARFNEDMAPDSVMGAFTLLQGDTPVPGVVTVDGDTATFDPDETLDDRTVYTGTISTASTDLAGNALASAYSWMFTTGDSTAPRVESTNPDSDAVDFPVTSSITAVFTEDMSSESVIAGFSVRQGETEVAGVVTVDGDTATFQPEASLEDRTVYTATLSTQSTDVAGNALASAYTWMFTTGDSTAPTIESRNPAPDATDVASSTTVSAVFSEDMDSASVITAFTLMEGTNPVAGVVTVVGDTATFTPDALLLDNMTPYTANISTEARDLAGNALASASSWTFTTVLNAAPTVSSTMPGTGGTNVPVNTSVTAVFSEDIEPASIVGAFTVMAGLTPVTGTVMLVGDTATFTPNGALDEDTVYTATISTAVTDLSGIAMANARTWNFTTIDETAPTVELTAPGLGELDVSGGTMVSATFSESMAPAATMGSFTLMQGTDIVPGVVTFVGDTLTFVPDARLADDTLYSANISVAATDLAGNPLLLPFPWTFTTGDGGDPLILSTNPAHMTTQVAVNKTVTALFDEDLDPLTVTMATFTLDGPGPIPVAGVVGYDALGRIASFNPDANLAINTQYTAKISTAVTDMSGNALAQDAVWTFTTGTSAAQTVIQLPVPLGAAGPFSILAASGITNIPTSMITGNVGLSPAGAASITGFSMPASCPEIIDTLYVVGPGGPACAMQDPPLLDMAKLAAIAAYGNAVNAVRGTPAAISGNLNGLTLYPGLYESGTSIEISAAGSLFLDAQGDSSAVFIIRSATTITTEATSQVVLTKGANANNIFWTAGSAITLGTGSRMSGTMIAATAISLLAGARLDGRVLTQGPAATAITLSANRITLPLP
jgi:hypothetical protein